MRDAVFVARAPAPPLDAFVHRLWYYECPAPAHAYDRIMPSGRMQLIVNLAHDAFRIVDGVHADSSVVAPGIIVAGAYTRPFLLDTAQQSLTVGASFRAGGAFPFLGLPGDALRDRDAALEDLWGRTAATELRERLLDAPGPDAKLALLERALAARLRAPAWRAPHPAVRWALAAFRRAPAETTVGRVTERAGLSRRRLTDLFREEVGLAPKLHCRVQRFQRALVEAHAGAAATDPARSPGWAALAARCGYADQAHLVREFRGFAGVTPGEWLRRRGVHVNHLPEGG